MKDTERKIQTPEGEADFKYVAQEAKTEAEVEEFFRLHSTIWKAENIDESVEKKLKVYEQGDQRIYVVKNSQGKIIAGAKMRMVDNGEGKEAYFNQKVVDPEYRDKEIGPIIVKERFRVLKEEGCFKIYGIILKGNIGALRTMFKDGFVLEKSHPDKFYEDKNNLPKYYYTSIDLNKPSEPLSVNELEKIPEVTDLQSGNSLIMIDFANTELIDSALNQGYKGLRVLTSKDSPKIQKPMMVLKKASPEV